MRITSIETVLLRGPTGADPWSVLPAEHTAAIIEVHTDAGLIGLGETYAGAFVPRTVPPIVEALAPVLIGQELTEVRAMVARLRHEVRFWAGTGLARGVMSGVEAALWDLSGKAQGVPVHRLLGGPRHDRLPLCATGGPSLWPLDALCQKVEYYLGLGFQAVRFALEVLDTESGEYRDPALDVGEIIDAESDKFSFLRARLGPDIGLAIDGHMGHRPPERQWSLDTAAEVLTALAPFDLLYFEEPLDYRDPDEYAELAARSPIPVAGGESFTSAGEFAPWPFPVAQPDASWAGITDLLAVAERANTIAPHTWSAGVGSLQNIHAGFASANTLTLELPPAVGPLHSEIWGDSISVHDGHILPPDAPGWGAQLSEDTKRRFAW